VAFQVVTRANTWELRHALRSSNVMYVDNIMGVCFAEDLAVDLARARDTCTSLLGPGSVADDKTESGVRLGMIGYTISLPDNRVLISRKNFQAALHDFTSTNVTKRIYLRAAQRLASYGTRYGKICRVMRPFCGALYRVTWGRVDEHAIFQLSPEAIIAIQSWRAMLCLVRFKETEFTRVLRPCHTHTSGRVRPLAERSRTYMVHADGRRGGSAGCQRRQPSVPRFRY
jgi:hypothetical protein